MEGLDYTVVQKYCKRGFANRHVVPAVRVKQKQKEGVIMSGQSFTITVDVKELLTEFIPKLAGIYLAMRDMQDELKGTELTLNVDVSGTVYGYHITDGVNFDVKEGPIDNPMVYLSIPLETMAKLADMRNIDMLINTQGQLSVDKYSVLAGLKGTAVFQLVHDDGEISKISAVFNGAEFPKVTLKLSMEDANRISSGQDNPIQLFMSGRMEIDGDMAFAMALQPLFS